MSLKYDPTPSPSSASARPAPSAFQHGPSHAAGARTRFELWGPGAESASLDDRGGLGLAGELEGRMEAQQVQVNAPQTAFYRRLGQERKLGLGATGLPSPPASPPRLYTVALPRTTSQQRQPVVITSQSPSALRDISASTIADERRSVASRLPLTPPTETIWSPFAADRPVAPSAAGAPRRAFPPPSLSHHTSERPSLTPSSSNSTATSKRSSFIKRKPVPQYEEEVDIVDDPLWDPTSPKYACRGLDVTGSVVSQMRRMSVDEHTTDGSHTGLGVGQGRPEQRRDESGFLGARRPSSISTARLASDTGELLWSGASLLISLLTLCARHRRAFASFLLFPYRSAEHHPHLSLSRRPHSLRLANVVVSIPFSAHV